MYSVNLTSSTQTKITHFQPKPIDPIINLPMVPPLTELNYFVVIKGHTFWQGLLGRNVWRHQHHYPLTRALICITQVKKINHQFLFLSLRNQETEIERIYDFIPDR